MVQGGFIQNNLTSIRVLTISVHYNNSDDVVNYLNNIFYCVKYSNHIVIVVDNSLNIKDSLVDFKEYFENGRLIIYKPNDNLGYYGAAAFALHQFQEKNSLPDWVIVSNTDIKIVDKYFFNNLISKFQSNQKVGIVSPHIQSSESAVEWVSYQKKRASVNTIKIKRLIYNTYPLLVAYDFYTYVRWLLRHKFFAVFYVNKQNTNHPKKDAFSIYAPAGAYTIFKKSYFLAGGTLKSGAFLYGEEVFVAEEARKLEIDIYHEPSLRIIQGLRYHKPI